MKPYVDIGPCSDCGQLAVYSTFWEGYVCDACAAEAREAQAEATREYNARCDAKAEGDSR